MRAAGPGAGEVPCYTAAPGGAAVPGVTRGGGAGLTAVPRRVKVPHRSDRCPEWVLMAGRSDGNGSDRAKIGPMVLWRSEYRSFLIVSSFLSRNIKDQLLCELIISLLAHTCIRFSRKREVCQSLHYILG